MTTARIGADGVLHLPTAEGVVGFACVLGRSGISAAKREGDGATPAGLLVLRRVLFRPDRLAPPPALVPVAPLSATDGWCDEPSHPAYNQPVVLPFAASHEALWRDDGLYDVIGVLGWNDDPVVPGRGSAIFLHVSGDGPTAGCIALPLPELLRILPTLTAIEVVG